MEVSLIGIGMGVEDNLTVEALNTIKEADVLIGASRMTRNFAEGKKEFNAYRAEDIKKIIEKKENPKKLQREINKELKKKTIGTKAQIALSKAYEENKIERKKKIKDSL